MNELKKSLGSGFVGGLLGALCCVTPLVLVLIGVSTMSGAMALSGSLVQNFRWTVFIPVAVLFLMLAMYVHIKNKSGSCNLKTIKRHKTYVITTVVFAIIVWVLLLYVIVPAIFGLL